MSTEENPQQRVADLLNEISALMVARNMTTEEGLNVAINLMAIMLTQINRPDAMHAIVKAIGAEGLGDVLAPGRPQA